MDRKEMDMLKIYIVSVNIGSINMNRFIKRSVKIFKSYHKE